jgi:hypothetical protein
MHAPRKLVRRLECGGPKGHLACFRWARRLPPASKVLLARPSGRYQPLEVRATVTERAETPCAWRLPAACSLHQTGRVRKRIWDAATNSTCLGLPFAGFLGLSPSPPYSRASREHQAFHMAHCHGVTPCIHESDVEWWSQSESVALMPSQLTELCKRHGGIPLLFFLFPESICLSIFRLSLQFAVFYCLFHPIFRPPSKTHRSKSRKTQAIRIIRSI